MIRLVALTTLLLAAASVSIAHGGDFPGNPECPSQDDCGGQQNPPPPEQTPPMGDGFCSGFFEGNYFGDPAPVSFQIEQAGQWGELHVTAWWRGGMWYGQGYCRQVSPSQAAVEIYFPGAPVHRAVLNSNGVYAQMDGQIDFGRAFSLRRTR